MSFSAGEADQLEYWASLGISERFRQAAEWNRQVWSYLLKDMPLTMDKTVGGKRLKSTVDEDDF